MIAYTERGQTVKPFSFATVLIRLLAAFFAGGVLGYGRSRKKRAAGLRTYILTATGACMAILLSQYEYQMLTNVWYTAGLPDIKFDASRYGAQVITGIGFLGAGTIIAAGHQQVSGLTTATGLFACACVGIAAGAGFLQCVIGVIVISVLVLDCSYPLEYNFKRRLRNMNVFVTFDNAQDISEVTELLEFHGAHIFELDMEETEENGRMYPSAVMSIRLSKEHPSHSNLLSSVAELSCVRSVQELIS